MTYIVLSCEPIASIVPSGEKESALIPSSLTVWCDLKVELPPEPFVSPGGSQSPIYNIPFSVPAATFPKN